MTFEDSVEKNLCDCLAAARFGPQDALDMSGRPGAIARAEHASSPAPLYEGASLLVALSGGADSTALLLALVALRDRQKHGLALEIRACHVNHCLRGVESASDELFCRELCQSLAVPLTVLALDQQGRTAEAYLRDARYERLLAVAKQAEAPYVVTGHNLDDQAETLLFRLFRGSSARGLIGMAAARPLQLNKTGPGAAAWPILLRPLLSIERQSIAAYLEQRAVKARTDSSNEQDAYSRNFLRNRFLRPLKERFPAILDNVEHFRLNLKSDNEFLEAQARVLHERAKLEHDQKALAVSILANQPEALLRRVFAAFMEETGILPSFQRIAKLLSLLDEALRSNRADFRAQLSLGENLELIVSKDSILLKPIFEIKVWPYEYPVRLQKMPPVPVKMPRPGRSSAITMIPWLTYALHVEAIGDAGENVESQQRTAFGISVDLHDLDPNLLLFRPRLPGDRLQPLGMNVSVRLKKYLHVNKMHCSCLKLLLPTVNQELATRLFPVLANDQEVLWVPGLGISEKLRAGSRATHVFKLLPLSQALDGGFADGLGAGDKKAEIDPGTC